MYASRMARAARFRSANGCQDTRRKFMNTYAETDTLVCMMHFPLPSCGGFAPQDGGFRFTYDKQDW